MLKKKKIIYIRIKYKLILYPAFLLLQHLFFIYKIVKLNDYQKGQLIIEILT